MCGSGPILNHTHLHPSTSDVKPSIFFEEHDYQDLLENLQVDDKTTTINVPVEGTPFALFEILTLDHFFGKTSPQTLLLAMVALAAALLGVMFYVMLIVTQNRVLHTRVYWPGRIGPYCRRHAGAVSSGKNDAEQTWL